MYARETELLRELWALNAGRKDPLAGILLAENWLKLAREDRARRWFMYHVGLASNSLQVCGLPPLPPFIGTWPQDRDVYLEKAVQHVEELKSQCLAGDVRR